MPQVLCDLGRCMGLRMVGGVAVTFPAATLWRGQWGHEGIGQAWPVGQGSEKA